MKVYHVELTIPIDGQKHFYFGSQSAIFDYFKNGELGRITLRSLVNNYDLTQTEYSNNRCIIRLGELQRKSTNRGRKNS